MKNVEQIMRRPANTGRNHDQMPMVDLRKTYRNQPCPCKSGKKFKHCCLKQQ